MAKGREEEEDTKLKWEEEGVEDRTLSLGSQFGGTFGSFFLPFVTPGTRAVFPRMTVKGRRGYVENGNRLAF